MMGVAALPHLVDGLLTAGLADSTPAAIIEAGTTPAQRTVRGSISALPGLAIQSAIAPPAVIVIGAVAALGSDPTLKADPALGATD
jgi:siroheme synthase